MKLSGHDIRMKEFRRALLRGYSAEDVDTFLMHLAIEMDQRDRVIHSSIQAHTAGAGEHIPARAKPPAEAEHEAAGTPDEADIDLADIRAAAADIVRQAHDDAAAITAGAAAAADELRQRAADEVDRTRQQVAASVERDARDAATEILAEARAKAERGLTKARERAEEMLEHAREQQELASRTEAAAELRMAHVEQRINERAQRLAEEARRLDALAGWMAQQDLQPDSEPEPESEHRPAHAAPNPDDVVAITRAAN
jgi:DivIVA domain-containing protein